jgi:serine/threonine protein kinase
VTSSVDPNRWSRIADLFDRAQSVRDEDRAAWLVAICGDDTALYDEVTSLLRVHEGAGSFISTPATVEPPRTAADEPVPTVPIGPYRVVRVLGVGGMGVVYLAEDSRLGRQVALKMVAPAVTAEADRIERLRREARLAASLAHPNIATVFALEEIEGRLFMVSEYVEGLTLRDELAAGPLPVTRAVETIVTLARALAVAHARGIVHRDLKPENIVRTPDGALKILDFGLAIAVDGSSNRLTVDGAAIGTPAYMSPEQIRGGQIDGRSDQFALGILLFELLTGTHPFLARTPAATLARILEATPEAMHLPSAGEGDADTADRLHGVIVRCLQKQPAQRFADAGALAAALERGGFTASDSVLPPDPHRPRALWWWQFHQAAVAAGYALLLIPLWRLRHLIGAGVGVPLFLLALVAAVIAGALRLHLWFAARQYPEQWAVQHRRARWWVRGADVVFATILLAKGLIAARLDDPSAPLLVAAAITVGVVFLVVEPATTRAAHGPHR